MRSARWVLMSLVLLVVGPAWGQTGGSVDERLEFLEERLDASKRHGQYWQWGWMGASVGGLAITTTIAAVDGGNERTGNIVEATKSVIGVGYLALRPMEARLGADPIRQMPNSTASDREARLRAAEDLLQTNARRSEERTDWRMYAGNAVLNGAGLGVTLAWGETGAAWVNFAAGMALGSLQIWSQPKRPLSDWQEYQQRFGSPNASRTEWWIGPSRRGHGVAFNLRW